MQYLYFDLETTALPGGDARDAEQARPVQAALGRYDTLTDTATPLQGYPKLINPGCSVHPESTEVHGLTDADVLYATRERDAVADIARLIADHADADIPIVGMNLTYDFTVLDRRLRAHGWPTLPDWAKDAHPFERSVATHHPHMRVIDTSVIERWADQFRPGKRKLTDLCERYGVALTDAHDADADAAASARLAAALVDVAAACADQHPHQPARYHKPTILVPARGDRPELRLDISTPHRFASLHTMPLEDLHAHQATWYESWVDFITDGTRKPNDVWPVRQLAPHDMAAAMTYDITPQALGDADRPAEPTAYAQAWHDLNAEPLAAALEASGGTCYAIEPARLADILTQAFRAGYKRAQHEHTNANAVRNARYDNDPRGPEWYDPSVDYATGETITADE